MSNDKSLFFAGVHWGSQSHQVCVIDRNSSVLGEKTFKHGGRELCEMARWLTELCGASPEVIAVGIEVPRGPVVESLLEGGFCVHSVTPRQLDRFRDRFCASGAKDDRRDAQVLASALRTDRSSFRHVEPQNPDIITLRELNRTREELVGKRTRLVNRLRELLWRYYPQFNELMGAAVRPWHLELWALAPEFAVANRVRVSTVRKLLRRHRIRRLGAEGVLEMLRSEEMNIGETTVTSCVWRVRMIIKRMKVLDALLKETEVSIREMIKTIDSKQALRDGEPTDVEILRSIPGVGDVVLATLLRCLGATAPVTKQSGETRYVVRRQSVCARLRDVLHVMGGAAAIWDPVSKAKYRSLRDRGLGYYRSVRTVADRLLLVACALLEKRELFDKDFKKLPAEKSSAVFISVVLNFPRACSRARVACSLTAAESFSIELRICAIPQPPASAADFLYSPKRCSAVGTYFVRVKPPEDPDRRLAQFHFTLFGLRPRRLK